MDPLITDKQTKVLELIIVMLRCKLVGTAGRVCTNWQTDGQYQVHYLPLIYSAYVCMLSKRFMRLINAQI